MFTSNGKTKFESPGERKSEFASHCPEHCRPIREADFVFTTRPRSPDVDVTVGESYIVVVRFKHETVVATAFGTVGPTGDVTWKPNGAKLDDHRIYEACRFSSTATFECGCERRMGDSFREATNASLRDVPLHPYAG